MRRDEIRALPAKPGVYLFQDTKGRILYVGKAQSLKHRVAQYSDDGRLDPAKREMVRLAVHVETIVTSNETEALALEASLIHKHEPPYNVRLVDDSSYLYVRISRDTYPRVELVRKVQDDGAWYRGPYPSALAIRRTMKEARRLFPWCSYADPKAGKGKACFAYHLGLCPGTCIGTVTVEEVQHITEGLKRFLDGEVRDALRALRERMEAASRAERYEQAAKARDAIAAIERVVTPQHVVTPQRHSLDAMGLARRGTHAVAAVLSVREGRVTNVRPFSLLVPSDEPPEEILRSFLLSYLPRAEHGSATLLLPQDVTDREDMEAAYRRVLHVPRRGWKRRLTELAQTNAEQALARTTAELESPGALQYALRALAETLHLERPPQRIEAYDVSNIQGTLATGSLVVFQDGKPKRSAYRKFRMALEGIPNDTGMMREMLLRRFGRHAKTAQAAGSRQQAVGDEPTSYKLRAKSSEEWPLPDLLIVDGGKGQLNAAVQALTELGVSVPTAALAKREEELFVLGSRQQAVGSRDGQFQRILLARNSPALYLLQRLRDEAHRFTLGYHQLLRKKRMTRSLLEDIPGVGNMTRKKLLRTFGSLRAIRTASPEELTKIVGPKLAGIIHTALRPPG